VAAILIEKGVALFTGFLGTWLPLGLIFSATYLTKKNHKIWRRNVLRRIVMNVKSLFFGLFIIVLAATTAQAVPTQITVRVKAKDAKFVGTSMGGVLITVRDVQTGELLAKGYTAGSTGNTQKIMAQAVRGIPLSDESTAKFTATIDISEPTQIEVTAYGPSAGLQSANKVSATQWVVPGKNITAGDAWMMVMPGFIVNVLAPPTHLELSGAPQVVTIKANITMMCGCPITPGGIWDANKIEVKALLKKDGEQVGVLPMQYAGLPSQFLGIWNIQDAGVYEATVYAYDAATGNTGINTVTFTVAETQK
jgi:hypothetical protein